MALRTSDTEEDKKNPSQAGYEKLVSQEEADELHNQVYGDDVERGLREAEGNVGSAAQDDRSLSEAENNPVGWDSSGVKGRDEDSPKKGFWAFIKSRRGATGLSVTAVAGGGIITTIFFGGMLAPISFFQNVTDDLNDQLAALDRNSTHVFRSKFSGTPATSGCTVLSIRCKVNTMTDKEIARYKRVGIEIEGTKFLGRTKPTLVRYKGEALDAQGFYNRYQTDNSLRRDVRRANNMKILGLSDSRFVNWTLKKFGISRKPPELRGSHEDRVKALMNKARVTDVDNISFSRVDPDSDEYRLVGDRSNDPQTYTQEQVEEMERSVARVKNTPPPSRLRAVGVGAVSVIGAYDLACSVVNTIGMAGTAAKIANALQLAQYAMPVASATAKIQAGDATPEDAEVVGEFFSQVDSRKEIVNTNEMVSEVNLNSGSMTTNNTLITNPNYGKNGMDSDLYRLSTYGDIPAPSTDRLAYALGYSQNSFLRGTAVTADVLKELVNLGSDGAACGIAQNWLVRGVGIVAGIALGVVSGGTSLAVSAGASIAIGAALIVADSMLNSALEQNLFAEGMENDPVGRANGVWGGVSVIQGESAKSRGLIPGNTDQLLTYQKLRNESLQEYIAIETEDTSPFDLTSRYSFFGSFINSMSQYIKPTTTISSLFPSLASTVFGSFNKAVGPKKISAQSLNPDRFSQCDDTAYKDLGINADVQCNVRYYMPEKDLALEPNQVLDYMESNGYIEENSLTGVPSGYAPPDAASSQGLAMDMLKGVVSTFYNNRYDGMNSAQKDYAQYLDFCVYRAMPWGDTYEESGAFGDAHIGYKNGTFCLDTTEDKYSYFRAMSLLISTTEAMGEETEDQLSATSSNSVLSLPSGTAANLAKIILETGNVTDSSSGGQLTRVANGQSPLPSGGPALSQNILAIIAAAATAGNKFNISSLARNYVPTNGSTTSRHLSGRAFDVSGSVNGAIISYTGHNTVVQEFINQLADILPENCEIGVPNQLYVNATKLVAKSSCTVFIDKGTGAHLHFSVR